MWGVYPETCDWQVAAVNSEFKLDAPISGKIKAQKPLKIYTF